MTHVYWVSPMPDTALQVWDKPVRKIQDKLVKVSSSYSSTGQVWWGELVRGEVAGFDSMSKVTWRRRRSSWVYIWGKDVRSSQQLEQGAWNSSVLARSSGWEWEVEKGDKDGHGMLLSMLRHPQPCPEYLDSDLDPESVSAMTSPLLNFHFRDHSS